MDEKIEKMQLTAVEKLDPAANVEKFQHDTLKRKEVKRQEKHGAVWLIYAAGNTMPIYAYFM